MQKLILNFSVLVVLLCVQAKLRAQDVASMTGVVTDPSGAVIAGARVTALDQATGIAQSTVTTGAGLYSFISLNPGTYQVTAAHKGFKNEAEDNVTVSVDQVSTVNLAMHVGSVNDTVTVTASLDLLDTIGVTERIIPLGLDAPVGERSALLEHPSHRRHRFASLSPRCEWRN